MYFGLCWTVRGLGFARGGIATWADVGVQHVVQIQAPLGVNLFFVDCTV